MSKDGERNRDHGHVTRKFCVLNANMSVRAKDTDFISRGCWNGQFRHDHCKNCLKMERGKGHVTR